jgi:hypothetical protein
MKPIQNGWTGKSSPGKEVIDMTNNDTTVKTGAFEKELQQMLLGVSKYLPQTSTLIVEKNTLTAAQMASRINGYLQTFADLRDKKEQARQQLGVLQQQLPEAHAFYMGLKAALVGFFGRGSPELSQFGISVGGRKPLTSEQKAIAHARALNTRRVRGTLGRRQKLALGNVNPKVLVLGADGKPISSSDETAPAAPVSTPAASSNGNVGQGASPKPA